MVLGNLRRERYQKMLEGYEAEQAALNNEVIGLEDWVATSEEMEDNVDQFLALLEKYVDIPELTPPSAADSYLSLLSLRFLVFFVHAAGEILPREDLLSGSVVPAFADIHPGRRAGVLLEFRDGQFNGAVAAAAGGEHGFKPPERLVKTDRNPFVDSEWAHAAYRVANQRFRLVRREHFCLCAETGFVFSVVDFCVARRDDQQGFAFHHERECFCNAARFTVQRLRGKLYRGAGYVEFPHPARNAICLKICSDLFD